MFAISENKVWLELEVPVVSGVMPMQQCQLKLGVPVVTEMMAPPAEAPQIVAELPPLLLPPANENCEKPKKIKKINRPSDYNYPEKCQFCGQVFLEKEMVCRRIFF